MPKKFQDILKKAQRDWMDIQGVVAVAQGKNDQQDCIDVYITGNKTAVKDLIPAELKGYPVIFRESGGPFEPQS